jgi:hypothetical protein
MQEHKSNAGRKGIAPLSLFKIPIPQRLFKFSDQEL